uniref:Uncharacterized protein n=1 Tax=Helianthus annuus TaxID=4232 RepID=A0A251TYT8_HELAN
MIQFEASYNEITPIDFHFPPPPDAGEQLVATSSYTRPSYLQRSLFNSHFLMFFSKGFSNKGLYFLMNMCEKGRIIWSMDSNVSLNEDVFLRRAMLTQITKKKVVKMSETEYTSIYGRAKHLNVS